MLDADLTPPPPNEFPLQGSIPNPGHGIVDVIAQGMVEVKEGKLSGGVGASRWVGVVGGGMYVLKVGMGVVLQLPLYDGIVRPLYLDVVSPHRLPPW